MYITSKNISLSRNHFFLVSHSKTTGEKMRMVGISIVYQHNQTLDSKEIQSSQSSDSLERIAKVKKKTCPHVSVKELDNKVYISCERISYILHDEKNGGFIGNKRKRVEILDRTLLLVMKRGYYFYYSNRKRTSHGQKDRTNNEDNPKFKI